MVENVEFHEASKTFTVTSRDLTTDDVSSAEADFVVVATGHFSLPNIPEFKGQDTFTGKIMHCHNIRDWAFCKDLRICVVGGSYSAEDVSLQSIKSGGAKSV